jgi:hypothetical protein
LTPAGGLVHPYAMNRSLAALVALGLLVATTPTATAQPDGRTQALAKELSDLLTAQKLDAIATRLTEDTFAAALFFPGVQTLVVSAKYTAPPLLVEKIVNRQYRDVYMDLAAASVPESKVMYEDTLCDGLRRDGDGRFDIVTRGNGAAFILDGDHKKKKISEEEYARTYAGFEGDYEKVLAALIAEAKKGS